MAVGAAVVAIGAQGYSPQGVHQLLGQAWLASSTVGQITLVDGSTGEMAARVPVAPTMHSLMVAQSVADALIADRTSGVMMRVDGATHERSEPTRPLLADGRGLSVYAGPGAAYIVDSAQGAAVVADPITLRARGDVVSVAASLPPNSVTVDNGGRLWAADARTGDVIRLDAGGKRVWRSVISPGVNRVTLAGGHPAVIDPHTRQVTVLDPVSGKRHGGACLDLRPDDSLAVGGSSTESLVFAAVGERGALLISDLESGACSRMVRLGDPGMRLGSPVETDGRVFVPEYRSGRVYVVDLRTNRILAVPHVVPGGLDSFELLLRDGVVFYNDPTSHHAGVVRLDGTFTRVPKYDPANPGKGLRIRSGGPAADGGRGLGTGGRDTSDRDSAASDRDDTRDDRRREPRAPGSATADDASPQRSTPPPGSRPRPTTTGAPRAPGGSQDGATADAPRAELAIRLLGQPVVGKTVSLVAEPARGSVRTATWDLGDASSAEGPVARHAWTAAGQYLVSVAVTTDRGQELTGSRLVEVLPEGTTPSPLPTFTPANPEVTITDLPEPTPAEPSASPDPVEPDPDPEPTVDPPTARLSVPASVEAGQTVTADIGGTTATDGVYGTLDWGDGTDRVQVSPATRTTYSHAYESAGRRTVRLTVTHPALPDEPATDEGTVQVRAVEPVDPPSASLSVRPTGITVGDPVTATFGASGDVTGLSLDWGDGSQAQNLGLGRTTATHTYSAAGTYDVVLTVTGPGGRDTATARVTVEPEDTSGDGDFTVPVRADPATTVELLDGTQSTEPVFVFLDPERMDPDVIENLKKIAVSGFDGVKERSWSVTDGDVAMGLNDDSYRVSFTKVGSYIFTVTATTKDGRTGTGKVTIKVVNENPND